MTAIFQCLEPVHYKKNQFIHKELDDVNEIHFIEKGQYCLGYEINKEVCLKMKFNKSTVFGTFETSYDKRSLFVYKAFTSIKGYIIRKSNWRALESSHHGIYSTLKKRALFYYTS